MSFEEIQSWLLQTFGSEIIKDEIPNSTPRMLEIESVKISEVCRALKSNENTFFDFLSCLSGVDNGLEKNSMEVVYHLYSIPMEHALALKVVIPRESPVIPTVSEIWKSADWHEREAYDLFGIHFEGHPDLRRILLPSDWEGHPLRKDYQEQEKYHGITVNY